MSCGRRLASPGTCQTRSPLKRWTTQSAARLDEVPARGTTDPEQGNLVTLRRRSRRGAGAVARGRSGHPARRDGNRLDRHGQVAEPKGLTERAEARRTTPRASPLRPARPPGAPPHQDRPLTSSEASARPQPFARRLAPTGQPATTTPRPEPPHNSHPVRQTDARPSSRRATSRLKRSNRQVADAASVVGEPVVVLEYRAPSVNGSGTTTRVIALGAAACDELVNFER